VATKIDRKKYRGMNMIRFYFNFQKGTVKEELRYAKEYIVEHLGNITRLQKELDERIDETLKDSKEEDTHEIIDYYYEDINQLHTHYPNLFFNSTLIWLYSFLESSLKETCEFVERRAKFKIQLNDFGKEGIHRFEKYISKVLEIDTPELQRSWQRIKEFAKVRNLIVHNGASLVTDRSKKELKDQPSYQLIKSIPYIKIDEQTKKFEITDAKYLFDFADLIASHLIPLIEVIEEKAEEITIQPIK
jgi:hypothetical protein